MKPPRKIRDHALPMTWIQGSIHSDKVLALTPPGLDLKSWNAWVRDYFAGEPDAIQSRILVELKSFCHWLRSDRIVVQVTKDLALALAATDIPELDEKDILKWTPVWFQLDAGGPGIKFPEQDSKPLEQVLVYVTPDSATEDHLSIANLPAIRYYSINHSDKLRSGLPDTDCLWSTVVTDKPINSKRALTPDRASWVSPLEGILEYPEESVAAAIMKLAINLMAYYQSEGAELRLIEGRRKKDKFPCRVYLMGEKFKLKGDASTITGRKAAGGWTLSYRFWVSGHWRNQAHGPQMSLRKQVWIEPYQKGPDFAKRVGKLSGETG